MRHQSWKSAILGIAALSLIAMVPVTVCAQEHPEDHHDQRPDEHPAPQRDDHPAPPRDDHRDNDRADPVVKYRHDHPRASARCHDGFFTTTQDRGRACSKHGGIDVWLAL
jgi:hypothetical protein